MPDDESLLLEHWDTITSCNRSVGNAVELRVEPTVLKASTPQWRVNPLCKKSLHALRSLPTTSSEERGS